MTALHTIDDVAQRVRKSRRWTLDFVRRHGIGRKAGRDWRFTDADMALLIAELPCPSSSSRRGRGNRQTGRSAARISASQLTEALALASERLPPKSSRGLSDRSNVVSLRSRESRRLRAQPQRT